MEEETNTFSQSRGREYVYNMNHLSFEAMLTGPINGGHQIGWFWHQIGSFWHQIVLMRLQLAFFTHQKCLVHIMLTTDSSYPFIH